MKKFLLLFFSVFALSLAVPTISFADHHEENDVTISDQAHADDAHATTDAANHDAHADKDHRDHHGPAMWAIIPFALLLLMIATGPLFFEHFWHKNYPAVAIGLGLLVIGYYAFSLHDTDSIIHSLAEYFQFISLLAALFMAAGGIMIRVDKAGKPMTNVMLLIIGACLANVIGTTGASMLLIRPFINLNKDRIKAYHVVFFIFMVSNVGGALTPIGDPPLFLGFLKGVPFAWTITHDVVPWAFAILALAVIFFVVDSKNTSGDDSAEYSGKITIKGSKNFIFISVIIAAVFLDPNVFNWVPSIEMKLHGTPTKLSFLREIIMLAIGFLSYYFADKDALKGNEFDFDPIKEVAYIFIGIFFTMMPALALVSGFAKTPEGAQMINIHSLYWLTGALSGVLDNAPTYVTFLTAAIASDGGDIASLTAEGLPMAKAYAQNTAPFVGTESIVRLTAISCASVFFGAMTYIGNAPNFMVKSIAEQAGIKMPSFVSYIVKYSLVILLPVLLLVWVIFFYLEAINLFI